jgi:hypothetical protein
MSVNCEGVTTLNKTRKTPAQNRIEPHLASQSRAPAMECSQDADPPQSPRVKTSQTPAASAPCLSTIQARTKPTSPCRSPSPPSLVPRSGLGARLPALSWPSFGCDWVGPWWMCRSRPAAILCDSRSLAPLRFALTHSVLFFSFVKSK